METTAARLLREALRRSGMTARRLAAGTGISEGRVSDYLSGRHCPGSGQLFRMLEATGHGVALVRDLDRNGLVLPELLDLGDVLSVDETRPRSPKALPRFVDIVRHRG